MATTVNRPYRKMGFLLDGRWHEEGEAFEVVSPFSRAAIGSTFRAGPKHLEAAIEASVRSFEVTRRLPAHERRRVLDTVADGIRLRADEFSVTMALEAGKPIKAARAEVERAILT